MTNRFLIIWLIVLGTAYSVMAQHVTVDDGQGHVLMEINDEADAGSLTLPHGTSAPAETAGKLYNVNGVLFWEDAQLDTAWTRSGGHVHLIHAGDKVGIGTTTPKATLDVAGSVKITGGSPGVDKCLTSDATGLASWKALPKPKAAFAGGDMSYQLAVTPRRVKQVSLSVPAAGTIHVIASGYASWEGLGEDSARLCISQSSTADMDPDYLMALTDFGCPNRMDQFSSWRTQRGFSVPEAGTYTFFLWADAPLTDNVDPCPDPADCYSVAGGCCGNNGTPDASQTGLGDVNMVATYHPAE